MSLSTFIAILAAVMFGLSQVQRRTERFDPWLSWLTRALIVAVLGLVAYYFIDRFLA